jgi:ribosomal protein S18 acetylase RimI-like enzyme
LEATITIRKAAVGDAPSILACLRAAFEPYRKSYTPEGFADTVLTQETIQQRLSSMCVLIAVTESGDAAGTIACSLIGPNEGHLRGMAVLPEWQGRGVAEGLLRAAETELAARNCKRVTLDTTEPLRRAMRFYESHGYRRFGEVTDFFGMPLHEYVKDLRD